MVRRRSLSAALVAVATVLLPVALLAGPAAAEDQDLTGPQAKTAPSQPSRAVVASRQAARHARAEATPLTVTIDTLTPSAIPARGKVRVNGTVTNDDTVPWLTVNVYSLVSAEPMTTRAQIAAAVDVPEDQSVGERITDFGTYDTIDEIQPGESQQFQLAVDVDLLQADTPGVYWFGVHALGQRSDEGRDELAVADGRARTFLPLVPPQREGREAVSVVVPLRASIEYAEDGSLSELVRWTTTLSAEGRLRSLVELAATSGDRTLSWVVDPALVAAVRQLAAGNPPRSLEANLEEGEEDGEPAVSPDSQEGSPSPEPTPSDPPEQEPVDPEDDPAETDLPDDLDETTRAAAEAAREWLGRLRAAMDAGDEVMVLPFGDLDVSAATTHRRTPLYARALARSQGPLLGTEIPTTPVIAPPSGFLSPDALGDIDPATTVLVGEKMFDAQAPAVASVGGQRVVTVSSSTAQGGPSPGDPLGAIALRQRILADAAVRYLKPSRSPLVVMLGADALAPTDGSFFSGFDLDWVDLTSVQDATAQVVAEPVAADELRYPQRQAAYELDGANFAAAEALRQAGDSLQSLLTLNNVVGAVVADQSMSSTSYAARARPDSSRVSDDRSRQWIEERTGEVEVSTPQAVTLSSINGTFPTTIENKLEEPVTVTLQAESDDRDLQVSETGELDIPAGGSATVLLDARTDTAGVHNVTIVVTDKQGRPLGGSDELTVRSARVSNVIWLFLAAGIGLLFGTIAFRLVRRVRAARTS